MANLAVNTGSTLTNADGSNKTSVSLSTQMIIRVGNTAIGAIQELSINERRSISMVDELGTDGHIDSAPIKSTDISGSCNRIRFDRLRVTEAFSRGFLHVKSQRVPFDIDIYDRWGNDDNQVIVTTIKNIWIESIQTALRADNWLITDNMGWVAEDIYSTISGGPAATGGERGILLQTDSQGIERQTDSGGRRGALDAPGLLRATLINL